MSLLKVNRLAVTGGEDIALVDNVSFTLEAGEMLGLVGESGSGKTVTCRALMRLLPGDGLRISGGEVVLDGRDILPLSEGQMSAVRGREIGMIFQNPTSHLNPVMTIGEQIAESRRLHFAANRRQAREDALALLRQASAPLVLIVVNNNGGQIFSMLPTQQDERRQFYLMPQDVDFSHAAAMFGLAYHRPDDWPSLDEALAGAWRRAGATVIELAVNETDGAQTLQQLLAQVSRL